MRREVGAQIAAPARADLATTISYLAGYVADDELDAVLRWTEAASASELLDLPSRVDSLVDPAGTALLDRGDVAGWDDLVTTARDIRAALWRHGLTPAF